MFILYRSFASWTENDAALLLKKDLGVNEGRREIRKKPLDSMSQPQIYFLSEKPLWSINALFPDYYFFPPPPEPVPNGRKRTEQKVLRPKSKLLRVKFSIRFLSFSTLEKFPILSLL